MKEGKKLKKRKKSSLLFRFIKYFVRLFSPKMKISGTESLPDEPCIIIGNHSQLYGPIACELYLPESTYTWCAHEMMELREVPAYAFADFWSQKPKAQQPFFKAASYLIAPLSVVIFNNARTVPVYKDNRTLSTLKETVKRLCGGQSIVIFPEHDKKHNHIVYDFLEGFVDVARLYYKRTGKEISFVPMYVCPKLEKVCFGTPIKFSAEAPLEDERRRICGALMDSITELAEALPYHTVVPYRNIPKRLYPKNKQKEQK